MAVYMEFCQKCMATNCERFVDMRGYCKDWTLLETILGLFQCLDYKGLLTMLPSESLFGF